MKLINLQGKVSLITGASRGIGKSIAESLAEAGARVAIGYKDDEEGARLAARRCGDSSLLVRGDVADPADCRRIVAEVLQRAEKLDILVNNAATSERDSFSMPYEAWIIHWQRIMATNLLSAVNISFWRSNR